MELMPRVLVVCDSPVLGLRINVLICEDFCQQTPGLETVRKLRSNLILSPVMAGALDRDSGFYQTASQLVRDFILEARGNCESADETTDKRWCQACLRSGKNNICGGVVAFSLIRP